MIESKPLHHTTAGPAENAWTVCDVSNLLRMAASAARYWRDSGRARHA